MNVRGNLVAAGLAAGLVGVWDIRNTKEAMKSPNANSKEALNVQCIAIFPDLKVNPKH